MKFADYPIVSFADSKETHLDLTNATRVLARQQLYSSDFSTLQEAFDQANIRKLPLRIEPKTHMLPAPILGNHINMLNVDARGAFFQPSVDMPTMLELRDCSRWHWQGGLFTVPNGITIDNAIYVYHDTIQCTGNSFDHVMVQGNYTTGIRIGKPGDIAQCDHMYFTNIECSGNSHAGQTGIHVGTGIYANCLNHHFRNLLLMSHETHIEVDGTNAYFTDIDGDTAVQDFNVVAQQFSLRNGRFEDSQRLMVTGGPASYVANFTIEDIVWNGQQIALDGEWIQHKLAGTLRLNNVQVVSTAHAPIINAGALAPLQIDISGLTTEALAAEAFALGAGSAVNGSYTQIAADGVVLSNTRL